MLQILFVATILASSLATKHDSPRHTSDVDVAIIGGGASGIYAAIRLHQHNKTVAVVEQRNQTGGHVDTYTDPRTGQAIDVGVLYYHNISEVTDFAEYVDVPLEAVPLLSTSPDKQYLVDFTTASVLPQSDLAALGDSTSAYARYYQLLSQYDYLISGFDLPSPIPEDFTMSWNQLITKYNLSGLAYNVNSFNQGWVDILNQPALYVLKGFGQLLLQSFISGYEIRTAGHNNQELYDAAVKKIGAENVLLSSTVKHIKRSDNGATLIVNTPPGRRRIRAKKLLITASPLLDNLQGIVQLNDDERAIFGQFSCGYYWNGILKESGLSDDVSLYGVGINNPYYIADQPGLLTVIPSGVTGLHRVYYGSPDYKPDDEVSQDILTTLAKVDGIGYSINASIPFIRSHAPYHCTVSSEQIKQGFYDRLQALQGKSSTYYTGATFQAHDSGSIWHFTEKEILPMLLA